MPKFPWRLARPVSFHDHWRGWLHPTSPDQNFLFGSVLRVYSRMYSCSLGMTNLPDGVYDEDQLRHYIGMVAQILESLGRTEWSHYFSMRLTPSTSRENLLAAYKTARLLIGKIYPPATTTGSSKTDSWGLDDAQLLDNLAYCEEIGLIVAAHFELPGASIEFAEQGCIPFIRDWLRRFPRLRLVVEHISSAAMVQFLLDETDPDFVGGGFTPQHVRNTWADCATNNYLWCLPPCKTSADRATIQRAIMEMKRPWWYCPDGAPHYDTHKAVVRGAHNGVFNPVAGAMSILDTLDRDQGGFDQETMERFFVHNAPAFYGVTPTLLPMEVRQEEWTVPEYTVPGVFNFMGGQKCQYRAYDPETSTPLDDITIA